MMSAQANGDVMSAHDAEKKLQLIENRGSFDQVSDTDLSSVQIQTASSGAKFKYIPRGKVADSSLGPGWMDKGGYVWFDALRKEDGAWVKLSWRDALDKCSTFTLENELPRLEVGLPSKERIENLAVDFGAGSKARYSVPSFFSDIIGHSFWLLGNPNMSLEIFYVYYFFSGIINHVSYTVPDELLYVRCGVQREGYLLLK
jgi:hypothetical protein